MSTQNTAYLTSGFIDATAANFIVVNRDEKKMREAVRTAARKLRAKQLRSLSEIVRTYETGAAWAEIRNLRTGAVSHVMRIFLVSAPEKLCSL